MGKPKYEPADYLTPRGRRIFFKIVNHIEDSDLMLNIDILELSMLANSFDIYERMSEALGDTFVQGSRNGIQPRAEYNIMQQQYKNILTHSGKFGLNPADREKIFSGMKKKVKKSLEDGLDADPIQSRPATPPTPDTLPKMQAV